MFFRFAAALIIVVLISVIGVALEKQTLETKRAVSRQYYQKDLLLEIHAKLRLKVQQRTAPAQLAELDTQSPIVSETIAPPAITSVRPSRDPSTREQSDTGRDVEARNSLPRNVVPRLPLLRWAHPADVETSRD